jgi:serine/threonine-protein kinase
LLTGQPPFAGGTTAETVRRVLEEPPRRPTLLRSGLPRDLEVIALKCLEKEPWRRYGSAEALAPVNPITAIDPAATPPTSTRH